MTKTTTAINFKGGVGKTTSLIELATRKAQAGGNVLLIDTDPDMCATAALGLSPAKGQRTIADLIKTPRIGVEAVAVPYRGTAAQPLAMKGRLDVIPGARRVRSAIKTFTDTLPTQPVAHLNQLLPWIITTYCQQYDWILIDPSPSLDAFNDAVLSASDGVFVPLSAEGMAAEGALNLLDELKEHNAGRAAYGIHGATRLLGLAVMKVIYDQQDAAQALQRAWQQHGLPHFHTMIPYSTAGWKAPGACLPIWAYADHVMRAADPAATAFGAFYQEMEAALGH